MAYIGAFGRKEEGLAVQPTLNTDGSSVLHFSDTEGKHPEVRFNKAETEAVGKVLTQKVEPPPPPPPPGEGVAVARQPRGPTTPAAGWAVAYADGFALPIGRGHDNTWVPNTPHQGNEPLALGAPPNTNNTAVTSSSQVSVDAQGLHLSCIYKPNAAPRANEIYLSGCCEGTWPGEEPAGYACPNFDLGIGAEWAFEAVMKLPVNTGEMDPAFWMDGPPWSQEWDFPEVGGWGSQYNSSDGQGGWQKAGHYYGVAQGSIQTIWGFPFDPTAAYHTYTTAIHPDGSFDVFIDGTKKLHGPARAMVHGWAPLLLRNDTREYAGQKPFSGAHVFSIRSVAVYLDKAKVGTGVRNGGLAPGTTLL